MIARISAATSAETCEIAAAIAGMTAAISVQPGATPAVIIATTAATGIGANGIGAVGPIGAGTVAIGTGAAGTVADEAGIVDGATIGAMTGMAGATRTAPSSMSGATTRRCAAGTIAAWASASRWAHRFSPAVSGSTTPGPIAFPRLMASIAGSAIMAMSCWWTSIP